MIFRLMLIPLLFIDSLFLVQKLIAIPFLDKINRFVNDKNEKYYKEMLKYYEKSKKVKLKSKMGLLKKISFRIDELGIKSSLLVNPISIIFYSISLFFVSFFLTYNFFKVIAFSAILSLPTVFIPMFILSFISEIKNQKIEKASLNFLLQLKNYTKINNDIVYAFGEVKTVEPLQEFINTFLMELKSGISFEVAIQNLAGKVRSESLKTFFSNLEHCYLYGGSFSKLISKSYQMMHELHIEKEKRNAETKSARLVLFILIFLNLFVYITSIKNNYDNYFIMRKTLLGNIILYWNFISIWLLAILASKIKKLDY